MTFSFLEIPFDLLEPILSQLADQRSWHACSLVSKNFNKVATPLLYRTLDSRIITGSSDSKSSASASANSILYHPATTLLSNPHLALHVRHVTETGAVHRSLSRLPRYPNITQDTLKALKICKNLRSFTWLDDTGYGHGAEETQGAGRFLLGFISLVHLTPLPLQSLTLRTHWDLGSEVWNSLNTLNNLTRVCIWSMEGPPRVLQDWCNLLGSSLKELELGRCAGVPPTILVTVVSHLPLLTSLRLKGVPSSAILTILAYLKDLRELDVEYLHSNGKARPMGMGEMPVLRALTIRTSPSTDAIDTPRMWDWIRQLAGREGLEVFKLYAFALYNPSNSASSRSRTTTRPSSASSSSTSPTYTYTPTPSSAGSASYFSSMTSANYSSYTPASYLFSPSMPFHTRDLGQTMIPRSFILDLARLHSQSLTTFAAAEAGVMTLWDVECLCGVFPRLEVLECAVSVEVGWSTGSSAKGGIGKDKKAVVGSRGVTSIQNAISAAKNLATLKLNIQWLPSASRDWDHNDGYSSDSGSSVDLESGLYSGSGSDMKFGNGVSVGLNGKVNGGRNERTLDRENHRNGHGDAFNKSVSASHTKPDDADETEPDSENSNFTISDARALMLRTPESVLRTVGVGGVVYRGQWMLSTKEDTGTEEPETGTRGRAESEVVFVVLTNVER